MREAVAGPGLNRLVAIPSEMAGDSRGISFCWPLAVIVVLAVTYSRQQRETAAVQERHSFEVLLQTQKLASALDKAEIGSRGYLFTSDQQFLSIFNDGAKVCPQANWRG